MSVRRTWPVIPGLLLAACQGVAAQAPLRSPAVAASAAVSQHGSMMDGSATHRRNRPAVVEHYVDINHAGLKELMTLPGIGAAEARSIIAHRPYLTKTELVSKGALQTGPFLALRYQVVAMQKAALDAKPAQTLAAVRGEGSRAAVAKSP
jgi:hypothetical protein